MAPSPTNGALGPIAASPTTYESHQSPLSDRGLVSDQDRERSISVSPKTRLPSQPKVDIIGTTQGPLKSWTERVTPTKRKAEDSHPDERPPQKISPNTRLPNGAKIDAVGTSRDPSSSQSVQVTPTKRKAEDSHPDEPPSQKAHSQPQTQTPRNTTNGNREDDIKAEHSLEHTSVIKDTVSTQVAQYTHTPSPTMTLVSAPTHLSKETDRSTPHGIARSSSSSVNSSRQQPTTPQPLPYHYTPPTQASSTPSSSQSTISAEQPKAPQMMPAEVSKKPKKEREYPKGTIPIWAQKYDRKGNGDGIPLPNRNQYLGPGRILYIPLPENEAVNIKNKMAHKKHQPVIKSEPNGHSVPVAEATPPRGQLSEVKDGQGPLGPWEPTIINVLPHEEISRVISDFLFQEVVNREDVGAGPAGGGPGQGAVLEIEAKIGQLIDKNTNDRLRLPVMTECVLSKSDPNLRVNFKSSMTEVRSYN